jgi:hypothetical protein
MAESSYFDCYQGNSRGNNLRLTYLSTAEFKLMYVKVILLRKNHAR